MTLTVPRFQIKKVKEAHWYSNPMKQGVAIKDHSTDKIIVMVNLADDQEENINLAKELINTIEEFVENGD